MDKNRISGAADKAKGSIKENAGKVLGDDRLRAEGMADKAKAMREQELMRAQMTLAYRMGDHSEAQRLAARLAPDDPSNPHR